MKKLNAVLVTSLMVIGGWSTILFAGNTFTVPESMLLDTTNFVKGWGPAAVSRADGPDASVDFTFTGLTNKTEIKDNYPVANVYGQTGGPEGADFSNFNGYMLRIENLYTGPISIHNFMNTGFTGGSGTPSGDWTNDTYWCGEWATLGPGEVFVLWLKFDYAEAWNINDNKIPHTGGGLAWANGGKYMINTFDRQQVTSIGIEVADFTGSNPNAKIRITPITITLPLSQTFVDDDWAGEPNGKEVYFPGDPNAHYIGIDAFATIQDGIDAVAGSTLNVAAGTYSGTVNIENRNNLSIIGADKATTIMKASSTLPWNVGGYGASRQTVVRIVNSTNVTIENITLDCDLIKRNDRYGIFGWSSEVTVNNSILKNMSVSDLAGGYYEITSYFRAIEPDYNDVRRAAITISNNTFKDTGRVAIVTHNYVDVTITNNIFYKDVNDFGCAMEIGSQSTGEISNNKIYGYDTPAASDGSSSAGIYIENSFTSGVSGVTKDVLVKNNEIYGCQYGLYIGNEWDGYAGDVDIVLTLNDNSFHDNISGGTVIADEDKENGSSVSVTGSGNVWTDNNDVGLYIYTLGDGDITVDLTRASITGHQTGLYVGDFGSPSSSSYNISINQSRIVGNTTDGIDNDVSAMTVDATNNWWGAADGPGPVGPGSGDNVTTNVDYSPYLASDPGINILKLDVQGNPVYLQPGQIVVIDMDALNLAQHVFGCQAILNFSSTYFVATLSDPGSPIVQAGGGIWDQLLYSIWNIGGNLDVAVGVDLSSVVGTKADGTVAKFTLTVKPDALDGITQMVFRPDGSGENEKTIFSDSLSQPVYPGSKIASQNITIDGTAPVVAVTYPNGGENLKDGGTCTITWTVTEAYPDEDSLVIEYFDGDTWETIATGTTKVSDLSYIWTVPSLNIDNAKVKVTVSDLAGNSDSDESNATFIIDSTNPAVDDIKLVVEPGGVTDLTLSGTAVQGDYKVSAYVSDNDTGYDSGIDWTVLPTISVKDSLGNELTHVGTVQAEQTSGRFTLVVQVQPATANGTANIMVTGVTDKAGNVASLGTDTFNVNKNRITGSVQLEAYVGTSRAVTFVATGGASSKTWTPTLSFSGGVVLFVLDDVPDSSTNLIAKTNWSLRRKVALSGGTNNQWTADLTASNKLLGGDLNGSNGINILDYSILKTNWFTTNAVSDINGDGFVQLLDYSILKANFFKLGDPE